ncbi:MAG: class I SAM-dependent methyltransferase [bacterium]
MDALEAAEGSVRASVIPAIGRFLYSLVRCCRPNLALEVGTFVGYSALNLAQGLEDNGEGHLHCFDLYPQLGDYVSPILGPCSNSLEVCRGHLERAGLAHRISFHQGDAPVMIRGVATRFCAKFDLAFIDGDHSIRGCLTDWYAVDEVLSEGGLVVLHDTNPEACGWLGPRYLLEKLGDLRDQYHWVNMPTPDKTGLAMIQRRTTKHSPRWAPSIFELLTDRLFIHRFWRGKKD